MSIYYDYHGYHDYHDYHVHLGDHFLKPFLKGKILRSGE